MKITEIKVVAGKDMVIFEPKSVTYVFKSKAGSLNEKLAAALWKTVSQPAEKLCSELEKRA